MVTTTALDTPGTTSSATTNRSSIGSSILLTLGSGSGINVEELATNLTNAEKLPAQNALQGKIDKTEAKIDAWASRKDDLATAPEPPPVTMAPVKPKARARKTKCRFMV